MTLYDEINMLMDKLIERYGKVMIHADQGRVFVFDDHGVLARADTLLAALQAAEEKSHQTATVNDER